MALTIRNIPEHVREIMDEFKTEFEIKTDSKALMEIVGMYQLHRKQCEERSEALDAMEKRAQDAERILSGLEEYLVPALENIRQQELNF